MYLNVLIFFGFLDTESCKKLDSADLRALWKKAINQQVLLIRMEKENAKLKGRILKYVDEKLKLINLD